MARPFSSISREKDFDSASLDAALRESLAQSGAPGAVACVGDRDSVLFCEAVGRRQIDPVVLPATRETLYDLASLTKVVATTTAILLLRDDGVVDLDAPASEYVPLPVFRDFTVRQLLTHTSGLVAGKPFYKEVTSMEEMLARYAGLGLEDPPGARWRYSDVGFMVLGKVVELAGRDALDRFCRRRIFDPLGMTRTGFNPPSEWKSNVAATERCPWRGRVLVGEVHDENAFAVGGVSGHAGLFSTADDLARFCRGFLAGTLLKEETVEEMTRLGQVAVNPWQGLGWWLDSWTSDAASGTCRGFLPSRQAIGHTGWTGTSLWMDRAGGRYVILLGNTCHPNRKRRENDPFRRVFHSATAKSLYGTARAAHSGLDRLVFEEFKLLRGMRIGLLTHHAAVDQFGRHIIDVMARAPHVKLERIYSPEHGLRGAEEAGAKVAGQTGPVPVVSLYGERDRPSQDELKALDALVIDLQDVGSRYYTYPATMKVCLEACARAGKPVFVLDRPNPVGGRILEGPLAVQTDSMVCWGAVPIRHGLTMGELAMFFHRQLPELKDLSLTICELDGWCRDSFFHECTLPWVPPSPNIPTVEAALLYVGMCLFEGVNLNEGRGTDEPFQVVGAPWLDAKAIVKALDENDFPGCRIEAVEYTPHAIPGKATSPVYRDQKCRGVKLNIACATDARPFRSAIALLSAIHARHGGTLEWKPFFDTLAGSDELRRRIQRGTSAANMDEAWRPALQAFAAQRPMRYA